MRKLKVALLLLFAMLLSTALFACKGGGSGDYDYTSLSVRTETVELSESATNADNHAQLQAALSQASLRAYYTDNGSSAYDTISGADCTLVDVSNVVYGQIASYYIKVTPTDHNPDVNDPEEALIATLKVSIVHDWEEQTNGSYKCSKCNATKTTTEYDTADTLHINAFHTGEGTLTGGNIVKEFGTVNVDGTAVKAQTYTVGRLTKGASITISGTCLPDSTAKTWYFPIIGVADRNNTTTPYSGGAGDSVIVRNEGWVLCNGVGTDPCLLGGLVGGTTENNNYGSFLGTTNSDTTPPDGYDNTSIPYNLDDWGDWWVFSEGSQLYTADYSEGCNINLTWFYRYDGVIEMHIENLDLESSLDIYVKVPDSDTGYYDTVLHGEYETYTFDSITQVTPLTLTSFTYNGPVKDSEGNVSGYLSNQMLDFSDLTAYGTYEQYGSEVYTIDQFDVYGFIESSTGGDKCVLNEDTDDEKMLTGTWIDLSVQPLLSSMRYFKISYTLGTITLYEIVDSQDADGKGFVTIYENAVSEAVTYPVTVGDYTYGGAKIGGSSYALNSDNAVTLTLSSGTYAGTLTSDQQTALNTTLTKYIAFRIYANSDSAADKFSGTASVKVGSETLTGGYSVVLGDGGEYADIVLALDSTYTTVVISGIQENAITLDLAKVAGLAADSAVSGTAYLNGGGEVTITYTFEAGTFTSTSTPKLAIGYAGANVQQNVNLVAGNSYSSANGVTIKSVSEVSDWSTATSLTVVLTIPEAGWAASVGDYEVRLINSQYTVCAYDVISYAGYGTNADCDGSFLVNGDEYYYYAAVSGSTLYVSSVLSTANNITSDELSVSGLTLNFNAGSASNIVLLYLSGAYENGEWMFDIANNAVTASVSVVGTLDDDSDVDGYAVVVWAIDLSKLGLDVTTYYFEYVDATVTVDGAECASVYTADTKENTVSAITDASLSATSTEASTQTCESVGLTVKQYKSGSTVVFLYAVDYTPAHFWTETDTVGTYVCSKCGAVLYSGWATQTTVPASYLTGASSKGISVSFWAADATDDWSAAALTTAAGNMIITLPNLDPWNNTASSLDGIDADMAAIASNIAGTNNYPSAVEAFQNDSTYDAYLDTESYVTITVSASTGVKYYKNGVLVFWYEADKAQGENATVGDFAELFLYLAENYGLILGNGGVTVTNAIVQVGVLTDDQAAARYSNYILEQNFLPEGAEKPTTPTYSSNQEPTSSNPIVIGSLNGKDEVNEYAYTDLYPVWIGNPIYPNYVVTFTGTMKSQAQNYWEAMIVYLFSDYTATTGNAYRMDNWVINTEKGCVNTAITVTIDGSAVSDVTTSATWLSIIADCEVTLVIDWSAEDMIVITLTYTTDDHTAVVSVTCTPEGSAFTQEYFNLGLGGEDLYLVITDITREQKVHVHSYSSTTDLCSCGQLNPNHGDADAVAAGTALAHKYDSNYKCTICGAINPNHTCEYQEASCIYCGTACAHENKTNNVCDVCGITVLVDKTTTGWNSTIIENYVVASGCTLTVTGYNYAGATQYNSLIVEFTQGLTLRSDAWGWEFNDSGLTYNAETALKNADGNAATVDWTVIYALLLNSKFTAVVSWSDSTTCTVSLTFECVDRTSDYYGYVYTCVYTSTISGGTVTVQMGTDTARIVFCTAVVT